MTPINPFVPFINHSKAIITQLISCLINSDIEQMFYNNLIIDPVDLCYS